MQNLAALLNARQFDGLAITKTPAGYSVTIFSDADGWTPAIVDMTPADALFSALLPPLTADEPALPPLPY